MKMKYKINVNFRHWKKGDVLERYEYNKLPYEIKEKCEVEILAKNEVAETVASVISKKKGNAATTQEGNSDNQ